MVLDDAIQSIYETTGKDYSELDSDLKEVVDYLDNAMSTVKRNL